MSQDVNHGAGLGGATLTDTKSALNCGEHLNVGEYGVLNATGTASLAGTPHVQPIEGFVPLVCWQSTVMTLNSRIGEFDAVDGPVACDVAYANANV